MPSISALSSLQPATKGDLSELAALLNPSETIDPSSPEYVQNSATWSSAKNKHPRLVLRPTSIESLAKVVSFLATSDLDYQVRAGGCGSASASDVVISLSAFDDFEFNEEEEYVLLGSGGKWRDYYRRMQQVAPGWSVVSARTPCLGIGGSTLCSGFGWTSAEFGCVSDAANLLDARIVTIDGQVKWASSDPELLWAMRGSSGGFAIVTHFKFRARRTPENGKIWGGPILIPRDGMNAAAKGVMSMVQDDIDGKLSVKVSCFLYCLLQKQLAMVGLPAEQDIILLHAYDARGEEEGRKTFKWALDIGGAIDQTQNNLTPEAMANLQDGADAYLGQDESYWSPIALSNDQEHKLTEDVIMKAFDWWTSLSKEPNSIADNGWLIYELFCSRDSITGRESSAWPRPKGYKHLLLLGSGCAPDSSKEISDKSRNHIIDAHEQIMGKSVRDVDVVAHALEDFHNIPKVFGDHYEKLRQVKTRVDPQNRLPGHIPPYSKTATNV